MEAPDTNPADRVYGVRVLASRPARNNSDLWMCGRLYRVTGAQPLPDLVDVRRAESGRADGAQNQIGLWKTAIAACATAGLGLEQQVSTWQLASALLASGAAREAAELLRSVHAYAVQQSTTPLQTRVEELVASARMSLTSPRVPAPEAEPAAFTGLTARETEVLAHLVANRTNAEIAQALFISQRTVSMHVSNPLRKTQTGSRREVAALARRVGWLTSR